jgi:hypothetical protein
MKTIKKVWPPLFYNIKEFVQPKMSLNSREFLIWKERRGGRVRERQVGILKVMLGLREIER